MGVSRVLGFCAAFLLAAPVSAAEIIDLGPSDYRSWGSGTFQHHADGLNAKFGQTIRMPSTGANLAVTRNPVIPYSSIANGAKNFVRINPASIAASAAITTLFLGLDWLFDEGSQSWVKQGDGDIYEDPDFVLYRGGHVFSNGTRVEVTGPTAEIACQRLTSAAGFPFSHVSMVYSDGRFARCLPSLASVSLAAQCPSGLAFDPAIGACRGDVSLVPLTEADWLELQNRLPAENPDLVGTAAKDMMDRQGAPLAGYQDLQMEGPSSVAGPETITTTITETGDSIVTSTQTTTNISYGPTSITTTNTTVTNTYNNGVHTGTETTTETPGELPVTPSEWPGFCDWASIVCDWIDWTREEPDSEPDLPEVMDDDFYEQKSIQFGSKTCPPDYEINIAFLDTTVGVSMQPFCDFAGIIYYMVMAAAYIIAAYISIGVVRNG